jgi:hypothetical protein
MPATRGGTATRWQESAAPRPYQLARAGRLHGPQNAKLRDGRIDIKRLQRVDDDGLELWEPVFKPKFPLSRKKIEVHLVHFSKGLETKEESGDDHVVNLVLQH